MFDEADHIRSDHGNSAEEHLGVIAMPIHNIANGLNELVLCIQNLCMVIEEFLAGVGKYYLFLFAEAGLIFLVAQVIAPIQKGKIFFITLEIDTDNCDFSIRTQ